MKTLKIFVAGSKKLAYERNLFKIVASDLQTEFRGRGRKSIHIEVMSFENFDVFFKEHLKGAQEAYNNYIVKDADAVFFVLDDSIGGVTRKEFDLAYDSFKENGRPLVSVFSRHSDCMNEDIAAIRHLCDLANQYYNEYVDYDNLRRLIADSIRSLCNKKIEETLHKKRKKVKQKSTIVRAVLFSCIIALIAVFTSIIVGDIIEERKRIQEIENAKISVINDVELDASMRDFDGERDLGRRGYQVGDYYDDGEKQGVVFVVSKNGKHGRIVSLDRSDEIPWAVDDTLILESVSHNTKHMDDGMENHLHIIKQDSNWRRKYPAMAWCANKGDGWYLPAINELKLLILDEKVHDTVNNTLAIVGGTQLLNIGRDNPDKLRLYSSTESNVCVYTLVANDGIAYKNNKYHTFCVRAVAAF